MESFKVLTIFCCCPRHLPESCIFQGKKEQEQGQERALLKKGKTTRGCEEKNGFNLGSFVSDGVTAIFGGEDLN